MSAISGAALVAAALLSACGGGHRVRTPSRSIQPPSSTTTAATSATTGTVASPAAGAYWPYEKLLGRLAGQTVALPHGPVRLDSALVECNGEGAMVKTGATRRWSRYLCTQTLFQNDADRDVTFEVTILSASRMSITAPRYGPN